MVVDLELTAISNTQETPRIRETKALPEDVVLVGETDPRYEPVYFMSNSLGHLLDYHSTTTDSSHEDISMALGNWCISPDGQEFTEITDVYKIPGVIPDPQRSGEIIIPAEALAEANQVAKTLRMPQVGIIHDHRGTAPTGQEAHPPVPTIPGDVEMMNHICITPEHLFIITRPLENGVFEIALWRNDPDKQGNLIPQKGFYVVGQHEGFNPENIKVYNQSCNIKPEIIEIEI